MKLEDQVCSLELSKRLKELGIKQESLWAWEIETENKWFLVFYEEGINSLVSAFTVAELGELLPQGTVFRKGYVENNNQILCKEGGFNNKDYSWANSVTDKTEANARAKMLIHLIEKGVVNP